MFLFLPCFAYKINLKCKNYQNFRQKLAHFTPVCAHNGQFFYKKFA